MISITDGLQALYNSNMIEKTPLELEKENRLLRQQLDQLTNNWNELEEWLEKQKIRNSEWEKFVQKDTRLGIPIGYLLDKMKQIKEGNNVSSRN